MKNIIEKTQTLKKMIDYGKGSVVSQEVIRKDKGTVTLFAFDKGQGLSEHTAPFDAMILVFDGRAQVTITGKPHNLKAGDMIIMPANKPHSVKAVAKFKMALVMIRA